MRKIKVVGLTGQTGAGKTRVAELLRQTGIPVIDADEVSRFVVEKNQMLVAELALAFGVGILDVDGKLVRKKLGRIVFGDKEKLDMLGSIIYPYIRAEVDSRVAALQAAGETMVVLDAPTLFESGAHKTCDAVVVVIAPLDLRLNRIIIRDRLTDEEARNRIRSQHDDEFYTQRADYILENDGSEAELEQKAYALAASLRALAGEVG